MNMSFVKYLKTTDYVVRGLHLFKLLRKCLKILLTFPLIIAKTLFRFQKKGYLKLGSHLPKKIFLFASIKAFFLFHFKRPFSLKSLSCLFGHFGKTASLER